MPASPPATAAGRRVRRRGRQILVPLALFLAALLIWQALPRLVSAVLLAGGRNVVQAVSNGQDVDLADLDQAIGGYRRALVWHDDATDHAVLGRLLLVAARRTGLQTGAGAAMLVESIEELREGLSRAPAQPFFWLYLAHALSAADATPEAISAALLESIRTGPSVPQLVPWRLRLGLLVWPYLDEDGRGLVQTQVRFAARHFMAVAVKAAPDSAERQLLRRLLAPTPELLRDYDAALRHQSRYE